MLRNQKGRFQVISFLLRPSFFCDYPSVAPHDIPWADWGNYSSEPTFQELWQPHVTFCLPEHRLDFRNLSRPSPNRPHRQWQARMRPQLVPQRPEAHVRCRQGSQRVAQRRLQCRKRRWTLPAPESGSQGTPRRALAAHLSQRRSRCIPLHFHIN